MAETLVVSTVYEFDSVWSGVDALSSKGLGRLIGGKCGELMLSSTNCVESSSETLTQQGVHNVPPLPIGKIGLIVNAKPKFAQMIFPYRLGSVIRWLETGHNNL